MPVLQLACGGAHANRMQLEIQSLARERFADGVFFSRARQSQEVIRHASRGGRRTTAIVSGSLFGGSNPGVIWCNAARVRQQAESFHACLGKASKGVHVHKVSASATHPSEDTEPRRPGEPAGSAAPKISMQGTYRSESRKPLGVCVTHPCEDTAPRLSR